MRKAYRAASIIAALALLAPAGCKKKEMERLSSAPRPITEPAPEPTGAPIRQAPVAPAAPREPVAPPEPTGPVQAKRTVLDTDVRRVWKSVEFVLREKKPGTEARNVRVAIGEEAVVPGTPLTIRVVGFVPEFAMDAGSVTTKSMDDVNPAAKIKIIEGGKEIWEGWAFRNYPDQHSFQDPRYAILMTKALKE